MSIGKKFRSGGRRCGTWPSFPLGVVIIATSVNLVSGLAK
jgi:hypothetical protein